ncbi:hypothetical protein PIB30_002198 [Stylosanthes scabra]|uniref:Uncharacterized protein n=1 Tax=Stylosanthes scabra TaxID=79078 RepID=A0ABU6S3C3_9FABA|nr:hypothetical protein [Stylosanthes scabra]
MGFYCSFSPFSKSQLLMIPSTNFSFTLKIERIETSTSSSSSQSSNNKLQEFIIELQVQEWYKLYVEPIQGYTPLTMEEDYIVSPKFSCIFKVPLLILTNTIDPLLCDKFISSCLDSVPIGISLARFLRPHIVQHATKLAAQMNHGRPNLFKMVYDVKVVKIDLAMTNAQDCGSKGTSH